jgi:hypothetical protein
MTIRDLRKSGGDASARRLVQDRLRQLSRGVAKPSKSRQPKKIFPATDPFSIPRPSWE